MIARRARSVKGLMLQAILLAGIVAAPLGSAALSCPRGGMPAAPGHGQLSAGSASP